MGMSTEKILPGMPRRRTRCTKFSSSRSRRSFYTRDHSGIPTQWVSTMRESMVRLTPQFSANRAVREYTDNYYVAAATAYCERARDHGASALSLIAWKTALSQHWPDVRFGELQIATAAGTHHFQVQVYLGDLTRSRCAWNSTQNLRMARSRSGKWRVEIHSPAPRKRLLTTRKFRHRVRLPITRRES